MILISMIFGNYIILSVMRDEKLVLTAFIFQYQSSSNMQWSSNFSQTPNQPQMLHAQQNQQQESNNLLMDLLQQMQQKDASQSMPPMMSSNSHTSNSGAQGFEQLFQQMHLRQNSYEQQHHTPSNQMLFGPQNNGNDFYRNNNFYDQHNYQPNPGKQSFKRFKQVSVVAGNSRNS